MREPRRKELVAFDVDVDTIIARRFGAIILVECDCAPAAGRFSGSFQVFSGYWGNVCVLMVGRTRAYIVRDLSLSSSLTVRVLCLLVLCLLFPIYPM